MPKRLLLIAVLMFLFSSCAGLNSGASNGKSKVDNYKAFLSEIPDHEFSKFDYHRNGYFSNANITALGAKKVGDSLVIDSIIFDANYGQESINMTIEGYKRNFSPEGVFIEEVVE